MLKPISTFLISLVFLAATSRATPLATSSSSAKDIVPNTYIITLHPTSHLTAHLQSLSKRTPLLSALSVTKEFTIGDAYKGYFASIPAGSSSASEILQSLLADPDVLAVEPDRIVRLDTTSANPLTPSATFGGGDAHGTNPTKVKRALVTQTPIPNWGLARISHHATGATNYVYDSTAGANTWAYILDTGVYAAHTQFAVGRANSPGFNAVGGTGAADGQGHGTAMAGVVAGTLNGVAKQANIVPVKVLSDSGSGTNSGIITGIQWAVADAQANSRLTKSVALAGFGGALSAAVNAAVNAASSAGLFFIVAAGNSATPIGNTSPGSAASAFVVGAVGPNDVPSSSNNYGPQLDIYAPGVSIPTTWIGSTTATITLSGSTIAAAHVAGVALYLMRLYAATLVTPAQVASYMLSICTPIAAGGCVVYNDSGL
ncbi:peptidase S8/S53 domain-containing protein [Peziza echinospora]|nr:peptidase S8/S53 domain-containing protein [Peziza echinospora]